MISDFTITYDGQDYPSFYVDTKARAETIIRQLLKKDGILAADTETAGAPEWQHLPSAALSPHLASPRLLQLFTGTGAVVIDLWATGKIDLKTLFESRPSVFHNLSFDYKMLRQHYDVRNVDMHCTMIMARCIWHGMYPDVKSAKLGDVAAALFGEKVNKKAGYSDWSVKELTFEQIKYAATDAILQMRIYEELTKFIDKLGLRKVYNLYRKAQITLCGMELNGIHFDALQHKKNIIKWREELVDAKEEVQEMTGLKEITNAKVGKWLETSLPPAALAVWPRTETGVLQTDANAFVEFSYLDIVKPFSRYQKLKTLTSSFGMNLLEKINPATGKIHPNYNVAGAKTGRLSCSNPNIQQMPRDVRIRSAFKPTDGYVMVVADYSQVEVRCIAEFSNDEKMLEAYEEGLDMYAYTAAALNHKDISQVTKPERQQAKALVLGLNYGLGAVKFRHYAKKGYEVEMSEDESVDVVAAYRKLYSTLRKWQYGQVDRSVAANLTAFSRLGKSRKMEEGKHFCASMNHPIQASCAEIMLAALVLAEHNLEGTSGKLLASVHDEIVAECLPEDVTEVETILADSMVEAYLFILPSGRTLKNLVEPSHGLNWAEAK